MHAFHLCSAILALTLSGCGDEQDNQMGTGTVDAVGPSGFASDAAMPSPDNNALANEQATPIQENSPVEAPTSIPTDMPASPADAQAATTNTNVNLPANPICPDGQVAVDGVCVPAEGDEPGLSQDIIQRMVGRYAIQTKIALIQDVPLLGEMDNLSTILGYTEIYEDGEGGLLKIQRGCGARSETGDTIEVVIPEAIPQSVEAPATPLEVWEENGAINWRLPQIAMPIGIRLDDPANDPLPTDENDPRIWDQDEDGNPGVTVNVSGLASGDIYVIQKQVSSEYGVLDENDHLKGYIIDNSEQVVIGATNFLLNQQIASRPHPNPDLSTVHAVPIDDANDCAWLIQNEAQLFPGN